MQPITFILLVIFVFAACFLLLPVMNRFTHRHDKFGDDAPSHDAPIGVSEITVESEVTCPFCKETVLAGAIKCKHCGSDLTKADKGNFAAGCLGLLFGPVGLWYKGHWAAGFAWLAMALVVGAASGWWLLPVFWVGMAIHAATAPPKG